MSRFFGWCAMGFAGVIFAADRPVPVPPPKPPPVPIIFDTDIGNDVDDALALGVLHSLAARGDCELLAVTVTKADEMAGPFVDAVNTFYGRGEIPIACTRKDSLPKGSKFLSLAAVQDGAALRYPHDLTSSSATPEPVKLLRQILAPAGDNSLVLVQVGFFSNFAALLDSPADEISPLNGPALVKRKVKLLAVMAGSFDPVSKEKHHLEYNVIKDIPAAQKLARDWPAPIVWSGFEIGLAVPYPAVSIQRDYGYVPHHPLAEAYCLYQPPPHNRPTWDLTAALYAVRPDRDYFELSPCGRVTVADDGFTSFHPSPDGRDRFLVLPAAKIPRVAEALVQLSSQPPPGRSTARNWELKP